MKLIPSLRNFTNASNNIIRSVCRTQNFLMSGLMVLTVISRICKVLTLTHELHYSGAPIRSQFEYIEPLLSSRHFGDPHVLLIVLLGFDWENELPKQKRFEAMK
jgi:hypothetical protein